MLVVFVLCLAGSRLAAQPPIQLEATPGFQGHVVLGSWAPMRVVIRNRGPAATGHLVIPSQAATDEREYRLAVEVPPSSRRAFTLYFRYLNPVDIAVQLRLDNGQRVGVEVSCAQHEYGSRIVLAVSRRAGGLSFIGAVPLAPPAGAEASAKVDSVVAYASPDSQTGKLGLPDHVAGYSSIAAVVLRDISPSSFDPDEQQALDRWVRGGGLLVVLTGPNVAELRDTFVEELAPVRIRGQRTLPHLEALARRFNAVVSLREALVADTEAKPDAQIVVAQDGVSLLVRRHHDNGTVYFTAADCAAAPLESENELLLAMWGYILADSPHVSSWEPLALLSSPDMQGLPADVIRLPVTQWNSFAVFGGFLLAYIVALFGLAQLVLRKTDRREWGAHVILLVIAVFSVGALALGRSVKLAFRQTYETGVAHMQSGSSVAWADGIVGLRSPNRHQATFRPSGPGLALDYVCAGRRIPNWPISQEQGFAAVDVPLDLWGVGAFRVEGPLQLGGQVLVQFTAGRDQNLGVLVENQTPYDLRYPFVLTGATVHPVNDVPAGDILEAGVVPRGEVAGVQKSPVRVQEDVLLNHCNARSGPTATAGQRIRWGLLRLLESAGAQQPYGVGFGGMMPPGGYGDEEKTLPLPSQPIFGAWIELPSGLAELSPPPDARVSEVLLLVDVSLDVAVLGKENVTFDSLIPTIDQRAAGIWRDHQKKLVVESGSHELTFDVGVVPGRRQAVSLQVALGCDRPGLKAEVQNVRTGSWEPLNVDPGRRVTTALSPPNDYVRWPQGWVKVRLSQDAPLQTHVSCSMSGVLGPPRAD
jgi:hypothetical protein